MVKALVCPESEQCSTNGKVYETDSQVGYAIWYPQMGGYVGKAVAVMDKQWCENGHSRIGGCIDVYVWHDGEFPFAEEECQPKKIHHCDPEQFIRFGATLRDLNNSNRVEVTG
jgi:hypothetical protein